MPDSTASFKRISIFKRLTMPLSELEVYYREQRRYRLEQGKKLRHIRSREAFYPLFALFLKIDRRFRKQTIEILGEPRKHDGQVIFACTHIAQNDTENIYESIQRGCWWFVGDPCLLYQEISGLLLHLNGCIFLETLNKIDRHVAYLRAIEVLKGGGSLMIFPEGARNGTENVPVWPLFQGTSKMAKEAHVKIVPVGIEQYDKRFVIKFGQELHPEDYDCAAELTQTLRDALATLKWDIWESEGHQARSSLPEDYGKRFVEEFVQRIYPWDTLESIEATRFHDKAEMEQREAFSHLDKLIPSRENAFLWRDRDYEHTGR